MPAFLLDATTQAKEVTEDKAWDPFLLAKRAALQDKA